MTRRPGPKAIAMRDAITAALRDADVPLATKQVIARVSQRSWHNDVYPNLRALERAGVVERADVSPRYRDVFWRLRPTAQPDQLNAEFEELAARFEAGDAR